MPTVVADVAEVIYYNEDASSPLTVVKPAAFAPGDLLVLVIVQNATLGLGDLTGPSGWTDKGNYNNTVGNSSGRIWSHVYTGGDPATWDFGYNSGADIAAALYRIVGSDTTPVVLSANNIINLTNGLFDSPTITPSSVNDLLIRTLALTCGGVPLSETDPVNMFDRGQTQVAAQFMALATASQQLTDGSATGVGQWSAITPGNSAGGAFSIVIKSSGFLDPDPPPNPPPPIVPPHMLRELVEARQQPVRGDQGTPVIRQMLSGGASNANVTLTTSATTLVDDILVVFHANNFYTAAQLLTPTGTAGTWNLEATGDNGSNSAHLKIWTRKVTVGGAQTVTVAQAVDEEHSIHLLVISGADTATWVDSAAGGNGASSATQVAPSVNPTLTNDLLIVGALSILVGNYTIPSTFGMTILNEFDLASFFTSVVAAEVRGNASATGTRTFTTTVAAAYASGSIVIKAPATAAAPTTTTVNAECATFAFDAQDLTAAIAASAIDASIGIVVSDPSDLINPAAESLTYAMAAQDALALPSPVAAEGTVAMAGQDVQASILVSAEGVTFTFSAQDATVSTAAGATANAEVASYTFAANDATTALLGSAESLTFTLSAQDATILTAILANAEAATFTLSAQDASVITAVLASAEVASFTFAAQNATVLTGTLVNAEAATFTFSAQDATVQTAGNTNIAAEVALMTVSGLDASSIIGVSAQNALFAVAGNDTTTLIRVAAEVGLVSLVAMDGSTFQPSGFMYDSPRNAPGMNAGQGSVSTMNPSSGTGSTMGAP